MSAELAFNRSVDVDYGVAQEVAPGIRRIVANNPGPYTFLGTNSYIVGSGDAALIYPGAAAYPRQRGRRRHRPRPRRRAAPEGDCRRDQTGAAGTHPRHAQPSRPLRRGARPATTARA